LVDDFLARLHYVSESLRDFELLAELRNSVRFSLLPGHEHEVPVVAARIAEVARKLCAAHRPSEKKVLAAGEGTGAYQDDPHAQLEAEGALFKYGQGRFGLGPRLAALSAFFDRRLLQVIDRFAPEPHQFPTLIGADVLERCKYLRSFPHALTLVSHLREDLEAVQEFARSARWEQGALVHAQTALAPVECLLAPAVCFHCFAWLEHSRLQQSRSFTAVGKCFRYEAGNLAGLERLWDFTMRELIFVGSQDYVLTQRQKIIADTIPLLDEWGLTYEISSATDPFFIEDYAATTFQLAFDLKFEIRAALPYKQKTLAVGSFNFHQDYFGRALHITTAADEAAFTGCAGFGLERLVLAFLAQHGLDQQHWPQAVTRELA
jgi:seryl-tRNA synthetase